MIKSDRWINVQCTKSLVPMIEPFDPALIREISVDDKRSALKRRIISRGLTSYGYDIQLNPEAFQVFSPIIGSEVDPKAFDDAVLLGAPLRGDNKSGHYWLLPPHTYALAVSVEYFRMPAWVTGLCFGKSTYARCGIVCNSTPLEAGWEGNLVLELGNTCDLPVRIYANEGIAQIIFLEADEEPMVSYADRAGKYQGQTGITTARL